jgi:hypothetical protein
MTSRVAVLTIVLLACAKSEPADVSQVSPDAGPPVGFTQCSDVFFGAYLNPCSGPPDCPGQLSCDQGRTFDQEPRCHARQCNVDSECTAAYQGLCIGQGFHFECRRTAPIEPTECRIIEGAAP